MKLERSLVRVKAWALEVVLIGCWLGMGFAEISPARKDQLFWLFIFVIVLLMFVRCERCGTFEFWGFSDKLPFYPKVSWKVYFLPKRCPVCGMERY